MRFLEFIKPIRGAVWGSISCIVLSFILIATESIHKLDFMPLFLFALSAGCLFGLIMASLIYQKQERG